jgi:Flp pilus assembly protein TadG
MIRSAKARGERGQTIVLVAISIVTLLGMAALAIDVVTLYVASSEIKRAADAAALAGAKGIADSGFTTLSASDPNLPAAQALAQSMATAAINAILPVNPVAGANPTQMPGSPNFDWTRQGNPIITVSLRRDNLPTFFAKIWGRTAGTVSASATAEVYNPSNNSPYTPIAPTSVKPWLVANLDPNTGQPFIDPSNGVETAGNVGEYLDLAADCQPGFGFPPCRLISGTFVAGQYVPAQVTPNAGNNVCPSSCLGPTPFEESIECADVATVYTCGPNGASWDQSVHPGGFFNPSANGAECLIHATGPGLGAGQDQLNFPFPSGPPQIIANSGPYSGSLVSTSSSIVTIPIVDPASVRQNNPPVTVVGFMQAFINQVDPGFFFSGGNINVTVLNIAGCNGASNGNTPVVGGTGTSPVPVRLITAPPAQ